MSNVANGDAQHKYLDVLFLVTTSSAEASSLTVGFLSQSQYFTIPIGSLSRGERPRLLDSPTWVGIADHAPLTKKTCLVLRIEYAWPSYSFRELVQ